jgi:CBS domain-containing protein
MSIGRICQREVDTADVGESARVAAQRMGARGVGALLVLDDRHRPIGILTDRDVALRVAGEGLDPNAVTVGEVMTRDLHTVTEDGAIEDSLRLMRRHAVRRLPVVDDDGALIGIVTLDDVISLLAEEMSQMGKILERSSPQSLARR